MSNYLIQLRPDPTCNVPGIIGLRRLLKVLLRSYGLVCTDVRELPANGSDSEASESSDESEPSETIKTRQRASCAEGEAS